MADSILILDFGSQYTQLIARNVRELNTYCEIKPYHSNIEFNDNLKGVILSGGPSSVNDKDAPHCDIEALNAKVPVLGICYGAQLSTKILGGNVSASTKREYGRAQLTETDTNCAILKGVEQSQVWMNSKEGKRIFKNFVVDVCGCKQDWTPAAYVTESVERIKNQVGSEKAIMALSGGVDSTVAATLVHKAIGDQLLCIFVDNGLLRKNEFEEVLQSYEKLGLNVLGVKAADRFYSKMEGKADPEEKRKIIGNLFIDIFQEEAEKEGNVNFLGQGTIYPDVIESVSVKGPSATIKSHHNVGGLPETMKMELVEPLRFLFKDEVRRIGKELGLDDSFVQRHPFPGPGLGIRILGPINEEKVGLLQEADHIFISALHEHNLYHKVWQAGAMLLPVQSVGVMGDERTYEFTLALRAVTSVDGMTADWAHLPHEFLAKVSNDIINSVKGINRVVYDISSKPPATIEWE